MTRTLQVQCCIVGGGPAGMMVGYLLARAGIEVAVLEKHADFLRDFRGDTVHPSTLEVMGDLGLLEDFLKLPHHEVRELVGNVGGVRVRLGDFTHLPTRAKFIALMPQWDFLNFLADRGARFPEFRLLMQTRATGLIRAGGTVEGVLAQTPDDPLEVRCDLVIGADGRTSIIRELARLAVEDFGAPMDVLWMRLPREESDGDQAPLGTIDAGRVFVMLPRGDYYQCGYVVAKGAAEAIKARGLDALKADIAGLAPVLAPRMGALSSWDDVKLLTVTVDRMRRRWSREGLLCIGDCAHAMSPIGGVGINLAIQDAVATANLLLGPLRRGAPTVGELDAVRRRRLPAVKLIQAIQLAIQRRVIAPTLAGGPRPRPPLALKLLDLFPVLRRIPARVLGMGPRMERVRTPDVHG